MKTKNVSKRGRAGFRSASSLLERQIQKTSETRGFAISKLLVNWADIIGNEIAKIAKPVKVNYGRDGIGAGLVLLTNGANAPIVQAQSKQIIDRVNEVYGYNAISRVRITQTDPGELINENSTNHKKHFQCKCNYHVQSQTMDIFFHCTHEVSWYYYNLHRDQHIQIQKVMQI